MKIIIKTALALLFTVTSAQAHSLWINSFESFTHKPGHTTVSIGWGHTLPIDDMTNSTNARIAIEEFNVTDPNGKKTRLYKPQFNIAKPSITNSNFDVYNADLASQKITLNEHTEKGVYLIEAYTKPTFFTKYVDTKGKKRLKLASKDKIKDIGKVIFSAQYQTFAKSYLAVDKWTKQEPVGHGLEITPLTDLSNVKVGDLVEFDVRFHGKPLTYSPNSIEYITAHSESFGQSDNFALFSYISNGKAQFRVQSAGQWLVNVFHNEIVKEEGALKDMYGKVDTVNYGATLTFHVK